MNTHNAIITRNSPTALMYLLDISGSMSESIVFDGEKMTKSEALSKIVNTSLQETILRCRNFSRYNNYFDIALLGYQENNVVNLLEKYTTIDGFCSISDIISSQIETKTYNYIRKNPSGEKFVVQRNIVQYVNGDPSGTTPMYQALEKCHKMLQQWIVEHKGRNCFPPIVINITDGEMSDASEKDMLYISQKIKRLSTENGNVILFNVHLSSAEEHNGVVFPNSLEKLPNARKIELMYEMSSYIPLSFYEPLLQYYPDIDRKSLQESKMLCYNTPINSLTRALDIGSISKSFIK